MGNTRQHGVSDTVFKYLRTHANQELHADDVATDTGLERRQVISAMNTLRSNNSVNITSPRKGWYQYTPGGAPQHVEVRAKGEVVAFLEDGGLLMTIEGKLYLAHELDIQA